MAGEFGSFYDGYLMLGTTDVSGLCTTLKINSKRDVKDRSAFGSSYKQKVLAAGDWSVTFEGNEQFGGDTSLNQILWNAHNTPNATLAFVARPKKADPVSPDNPEFSGTVIIPTYEWGGKWGDDLKKSLTLEGTGTLSVSTV